MNESPTARLVASVDQLNAVTQLIVNSAERYPRRYAELATSLTAVAGLAGRTDADRAVTALNEHVQAYETASRDIHRWHVHPDPDRLLVALRRYAADGGAEQTAPLGQPLRVDPNDLGKTCRRAAQLYTAATGVANQITVWLTSFRATVVPWRISVRGLALTQNLPRARGVAVDLVKWAEGRINDVIAQEAFVGTIGGAMPSYDEVSLGGLAGDLHELRMCVVEVKCRARAAVAAIDGKLVSANA